LDEFEQTEQATGGRRAYEVARSKGLTSLSYEDWLTVRMPSFKAWYGDWQAARAREKIFTMRPIPLAKLELCSDTLKKTKSERKALRKAALNAFRAARAKGFVTMEDGRKVLLTMVGFNDTSQHTKQDRRPFDLFSNLRQVLEKAVHIADSFPTHIRRASPTTRAYHYYGAKVILDGKELYAKIVIRESVNETIYYDNRLSSREEVTEQGRIGVPAVQAGASALEGDGRMLGQLLAGVNSKPVSAEEPSTKVSAEYRVQGSREGCLQVEARFSGGIERADF